MAYGLDERQTIFALASGVGKAAIAVIRISGRSTAKVLEALIGRSLEPRVASYCALADPRGDHILDQAIVLWFPGPNSFTGEDSAELQVHGARAVIAAIFKVLHSMEDLRLAQPGEFARRSLENGKLSLIQIEALGDLINSETEQQRLFAIAQASGKLQQAAEEWRRLLIGALVSIEAELDFSDEPDVPRAKSPKWQAICKEVLTSLGRLTIEDRQTECLRYGLTVMIAGPPNAGKSSLLNAISKRDVAIVSERAGTTRDLIEVKLDLGGFPVNLIDTAGIQITDDAIEREGIERARKKGALSDLVLWLTPIDEKYTPPPEYFYHRPLWHILTKADSVEKAIGAGLSTKSAKEFGAGEWAFRSQSIVSAKSGLGVEQFIDQLQSYAAEKMSVDDSVFVANERQRMSIAMAEEAVRSAMGRNVHCGRLAAGMFLSRATDRKSWR
jgi:tRNA modification GTPase